MTGGREDRVNTRKLMLYRNFKHQELFDDFEWLINNADNDYYNKDDIIALLYECVNELLEIADSYGFEGNLYHNFLGFILANNENAFSTSSEITGAPKGTINQIAIHDFLIFKQLMDYDLREIDKALDVDAVSMISDYKNDGKTSKVFNKRVRDRICDLTKLLENAEDISEYYRYVTDFYKAYGVGSFGLHKAFRLLCHEGEETQIIPVTSIDHVYLSDLVGYELQKRKLIENTEAFIAGRQANNVLLYGDAGTGKSSSIKAILNEYYGKGLRMIEVYKHQFDRLSDVIEIVKNRNYKFIIYMDDLSFEDFEIEYKYLKAVIEGGLGKKPENVLIYATSNRRHLIKESFRDKDDVGQDIHKSDTVQEKLSLAARFGVSIYYGSPDKKQFHHIVNELAKKYGITMDEKKLYHEANVWELNHGGLSGRTAMQFITYLLGKDDLYGI
ncbi:MAG: ATP-binding protein [Lachnospiraceae bacterium]|nr:ATP-binding protein [Lachnospiraceae bacterium]